VLYDELLTIPAVHFAPWYRTPMRVHFSQTVRDFIEADEMLDILAEYHAEEEAIERYLKRGYVISLGWSLDLRQTEQIVS
jgi:hypothetical protein